MSTPDQPLTRKQMRELGRTGSVPVQTDTSEESEQSAPAPAAPLPRAAVPAVVAPLPTPDAQVDLGVAPLTRRQAREQERIRTASVPVITPDVAAEHRAEPAPDDARTPEEETADLANGPGLEPEDETEGANDEPAADAANEVDSGSGVDIEAAGDPDAGEPADREHADDAHVVAAKADEPADAEAEDVPADAEAEEVPAVAEAEDETAVEALGSDSISEPAAEPLPEPVPVSAATVSPQFGAELLSGDEVAATLPPSFDELIARGGTSTGTLATPSALILSQTPSAPPLSGPVNATGEVIITGSYHLPEGLGSRGSVPSSTDGKDVDAVLIDGELPPASSPTPIAASAAISTVRGTGEIIRPPAPEKGSRLLFTLAITAGVLALALVGVLIIAVVNGAF
jgi:hypothetical protein